jgi:hypothetical protein
MAATPPPDIAEHARHVQAWLDSEAAADHARANPTATAAERFDDIRRAQYSAGLEGRTLAPSPAPVVVAVAADPTRMSASERWALMRATDQSTMKPYQPPA